MDISELEQILSKELNHDKRRIRARAELLESVFAKVGCIFLSNALNPLF